MPAFEHQQPLQPSDAPHHTLTFQVPTAHHTLHLEVHLHSTSPRARVELVVLDPSGFRGFGITQGGHLTLTLTPDHATDGALPGPVVEGQWTLHLECLNIESPSRLEVTVNLQGPAHTRPSPAPPPHASRVVNTQAGWYRGELHAHTVHSSGRNTVQELVEGAVQAGLDFLSLTDHNTTAGWNDLRTAQQHHDIVLLTGMELTTHLGHANVHGVHEWINPFVTPEHTLTDIIDQTHRQNALFCINHPFSNNVGWQHHDTPWNAVDLMEVYHHLEYTHNTLQLSFWDGLLNQGHRVVGVGATDSKNAFSGRHQLGQVWTCVHASELSVPGILQGLKSGQVYVSLGPELDFHARTLKGEKVPMGGHVPLGEKAQYHISVSHLQQPAVLYVIKNGLFHQAFTLTESETTLHFEHQSQQPAWFRLELHVLPGQALNGYDPRIRSWETFQATSNPIFVGGKPGQNPWK